MEPNVGQVKDAVLCVLYKHQEKAREEERSHGAVGNWSLADKMDQKAKTIDELISPIVSAITKVFEKAGDPAPSRIHEWLKLSNSGLRLRCGEMTAQEIRTVRAVLQSIADGL